MRHTSDTRHLSSLGAELVSLDLGRPAGFSAALQGIDVVVHAAGVTRARRPEDFFRFNARATGFLAAAAWEAGVRRFVLISSLAARGPDGSNRPTSFYGRSKLEAERLLRNRGGGMPAAVLRPAAIYGPRDTDLLPLFQMAHTGWLVLPAGKGALQPVYAADVARALLAAADAGREPGFGPHPVAEDGRYSWEEVAAEMGRALGRPVRTIRLPAAAFLAAGMASEAVARLSRLSNAAPLFDRRRAEDLAVRSWTCDPSSAAGALGRRAEVPLSEGLRRTALWYRREDWI